MRHWIVLFILGVVLTSGCSNGRTCRDVVEEAWITELYVDDTPVRLNYSGPRTEIKILSDRVEAPLNYVISDIESGAGRFYEINETGYYSDIPRKDETVTAYASVLVTNNDSVGGNFTVNWTYGLDPWNYKKTQSRFIEANDSAVFRIEFNKSREEKWNYSMNVIAGRKQIRLPYAVYEVVNASGERVIVMYNRTYASFRTNVTRTVCS